MTKQHILGDICEFIIDCEHKTAPTTANGFPSIRTPNIGRGYFILDDVNRVSKDTYSQWTKRAVPLPGDLIMAREAPVGNVAIIPVGLQPCLGQRTLLIRPDKTKVDPQYLTYLLIGDEVQGCIHGMTSGATVPHLNMKDVRTLRLPDMPPLPVQRKIAAILSAYDDLIENNLRRIKIIEEMARSLYREWFVNFRFPGHQKVRMVNSLIGKIPEGWEATPFQSLLESMSGGDWGAELPTDVETAEVGVVRGTDFKDIVHGDEQRFPVRYIKPQSLVARKLRQGDVVVENSINAKSRCVGTTLLVDQMVLSRLGRPAIAASFCKVFRLHESRLAALVHLHMCRLREEGLMERYQNVATNGIGNFQAQKFVKEEHLAVPSPGSKHRALVEPISTFLEAVSVLASQSMNLRQTRDLLLPKLISGDLDVSDLDIKIREQSA